MRCFHFIFFFSSRRRHTRCSRDWSSDVCSSDLRGFALESCGFALYVVALALAPLSIVQSVAAGGIGVLAYVSARMSRRRLGRHELAGVLVSMLGLLALAISLSRGTGEGEREREQAE